LVAFALFLKMWYDLYGGTSKVVKFFLGVLVVLTIIDCFSHIFVLLIKQQGTDVDLYEGIHIFGLMVFLVVVMIGFVIYGYRVWRTIRNLPQNDKMYGIRRKLFVVVLVAGVCSSMRVTMLSILFKDMFITPNNRIIMTMPVWYSLSQFVPETGLFVIIMHMTQGAGKTPMVTFDQPLLETASDLENSHFSTSTTSAVSLPSRYDFNTLRAELENNNTTELELGSEDNETYRASISDTGSIIAHWDCYDEERRYAVTPRSTK